MQSKLRHTAPACLLLIGLSSGVVAAPVPAGAKEEAQAAKAVKRLAEATVKAFFAGDHAAVLKLSDVPWCSLKKGVLTKPNDLEDYLITGFGKRGRVPTDYAIKSIKVYRWKEVKTELKLKEREVQLIEQVVGEDDRAAIVEITLPKPMNSALALVLVKFNKQGEPRLVGFTSG